MALQHTHTSNPFSRKDKPLVVVCDGVSGPANVGGLFRICEAMGVREIIFCNATIDFSSARLQRTARNTHNSVSFRYAESALPELEFYKNAGYRLLALEISERSKPFDALLRSEKNVLIIGNEQRGISEEVLRAVQEHAHIEMHGANSSINVVQATAIALYALTKL